jgi:hypothetical protein
MAKYRHANLLAQESCITPATKTIDLDVTNPISMIQIILRATSAGTEQTAHPAGNVTKIEVVDGSDVIASMSGKETQALDFYNARYMPKNYIADADNVQAYATFNLRFGRRLWDDLLALDPSKFRNLQLKVTHNALIADTAADAATLEAWAFMFDEKKVSPVGYLRPTNVYTYTNGASGTIEAVELPRDLPIRQMMIRSYGDGFFPWHGAYHMKISENGGAKIPMDVDTMPWCNFINQHYPEATEKCYLDANTTARHLYCAPSFTVVPRLLAVTAGSIVTSTPVNSSVPLHIVVSSDGYVYGDVAGWCPHYAFPIPFGDQNDLNDWYDVGALGSVKMDITAGGGGTSMTTAVVLEQLKRY